MSPDEQVYIKPHNLAIPQKYPARDDPEKDEPERDDQFSMSFNGQFSMSPDEQVYIRPHNLALHQKIMGKKYYIHSKSHENHPKRETNSQ